MSVTIDLPPEVEADLAAQAAARGLPLAEHLRRVLAEQAGAAKRNRKSPEERAKHWRESVVELPDTTPLSDEAISRESIYAERGETAAPAKRQDEPPGAARKSLEERIRLWRDVSNLPRAEPLSDEAISRESMYGDRGRAFSSTPTFCCGARNRCT